MAIGRGGVIVHGPDDNSTGIGLAFPVEPPAQTAKAIEMKSIIIIQCILHPLRYEFLHAGAGWICLGIIH